MDSLPPHAQKGDSHYTIIPLTQGYKAIVDPEDAELAMYKWHLTRGRYAMRRPGSSHKNAKRPAIIMHRIIMERKLGRPILPDAVVDHINGDGLDNRRANLREATTSQNAANRTREADKGIKFKRGKWEASIGYQGRVLFIGAFGTKALALEAYDLAKVELFGEFARTNHACVQTQLWSILQNKDIVKLGYAATTREEDAPVLSELLREKEYTDQREQTIIHFNEDGSSYIAIPMNLGKFALVDLIDADLADVKWFLRGGRYAGRRTEKNGKGKHIAMHHIILERKLGRPITKGIVVDHINGDGLDNRRENLREATRAQNMRNLRLRSDNTSQYKGVRRLDAHIWVARVNGQTVGYFDTALDASFAYDKAAVEQYGEFARLNHPLQQVLEWTPPIRQFGRKSASGYHGVQACGDRWGASIAVGGRHRQLGFFDTPEEAAFAYDKAALEAYGESALLNHSIEQVLTWNPPARVLRKTNTSSYRGVRKVGKDHWYAQIHINKEQNIYLGTFNSSEDAARVYDRAAVDQWGNHARLNFPLEEVLACEDLPRPLSSNTSGYRGVTKIKRSGKWQASYRHGDKLLHLGTFETAEEAARAYDLKVIELKGKQATLNFPMEDYENE